MNKGRKYSVKLDLCMYDMKAHRTPFYLSSLSTIFPIHIYHIYNYIYIYAFDRRSNLFILLFILGATSGRKTHENLERVIAKRKKRRKKELCQF
jgi:hypothetical protein